MKQLTILLFSLFSTLSIASIEPPKNIIMIIADGMGPNFVPSYRYYKKNKQQDIQPTVFDRHFTGSVSTYPDESSGFVTDSAASATALASGIKTYNAAIGVDINKLAVQSVLEFAKIQGKNTGIVVTSEINHATPASYISHIENRNLKNDIADSYFDEKINGEFKVDVMFGGGRQYFIRSDRNLINEFRENNYQYIDNYSQLKTLKNNQKVIGLFADKGLPSHIDDTEKYRLTQMTKSAVEHLSQGINNNNGFFLLIEASQIDWAAHNNDIVVAMHEMAELENTLLFLEQYSQNTPDTLIILTADHDTGGLSIGKDKKYVWRPEVLQNIKKSPTSMAHHLYEHDINAAYLNATLGFNLTNAELQRLIKTKKDLLNQSEYSADYENNVLIIKHQLIVALEKILRDIINNRSHTGWTTAGHTGADVPIYVLGKGKELFLGFQNNIDIAKNIFKLLGKK